MIGAILSLIPALLVAVVLFLFSPVFGVLWVLWLIGLTIYAIKKNKRK